MSENTNVLKESEVFSLIREIIAGTPNEAVIEKYLAKKEEQAAKRREADKARAAKKRAEGDEKQAVIKSLITDEFQTITELIAAYEAQTNEEITSQGLTAKLKNLIESKQAEKAKVKTEAGTRTAYRLYTGEFDEE